MSITAFALWGIFQTGAKTNETLEAAKRIITEQSKEIENPDKLFTAKGDIVGLLSIPKIAAELAIVKGTDPDDLERGVGHFRGSN